MYVCMFDYHINTIITVTIIFILKNYEFCLVKYINSVSCYRNIEIICYMLMFKHVCFFFIIMIQKRKKREFESYFIKKYIF